MPAVALEILAGVALGPSGLGWVQPDEPIRVLALLGLAFLLLLAGLELELDRFRERVLRVTAFGLAASFGLAVAVGLLSVLLFPLAALAILRRTPESAGLPVAEGA